MLVSKTFHTLFLVLRFDKNSVLQMMLRFHPINIKRRSFLEGLKITNCNVSNILYLCFRWWEDLGKWANQNKWFTLTDMFFVRSEQYERCFKITSLTSCLLSLLGSAKYLKNAFKKELSTKVKRKEKYYINRDHLH